MNGAGPRLRRATGAAGEALLWVVPAMWSSNYLIARLAHGVILPHQLAFWRWALALALMLPFAWRGLAVSGPRVATRMAADAGARRARHVDLRRLGLPRRRRRRARPTSALIYAATPVAITVVGIRVLHERMSGAQRLAVVAALAGVLFVIAKGDIDNLLAVRFVRGDAWIVAAAMSWVAYSVLLKRWPSALASGRPAGRDHRRRLLPLLPFTVWETGHSRRRPAARGAACWSRWRRCCQAR